MMIEWEWRGDLKDDCTAVGHGLMLRAEQMSKKQWWWAVYDNEGQTGCDELAASHDSPPHNAKTGHEARVSAELAAMRILYGRQSTEGARLRSIITELFEGWPEALIEGMDGCDVQEFAEKHGIFIKTQQTVPCAPWCNCEEVIPAGEVTECYQMAEEFRVSGKRTDG